VFILKIVLGFIGGLLVSVAGAEPVTVTGFKLSRVKCYCDSRIDGGAFRIITDDLQKKRYEVIAMESPFALIQVSSEFKNDYGVCSNPLIKDEPVPCWIKMSTANFIGIEEGNANIDKAGSVLVDEKHFCEDQGTMMGAQSCENK
jgi:hypothetical protein